MHASVCSAMLYVSMVDGGGQRRAVDADARAGTGQRPAWGRLTPDAPMPRASLLMIAPIVHAPHPTFMCQLSLVTCPLPSPHLRLAVGSRPDRLRGILIPGTLAEKEPSAEKALRRSTSHLSQPPAPAPLPPGRQPSLPNPPRIPPCSRTSLRPPTHTLTRSHLDPHPFLRCKPRTRYQPAARRNPVCSRGASGKGRRTAGLELERLASITFRPPRALELAARGPEGGGRRAEGRWDAGW